jgi:hypothetical protein
MTIVADMEYLEQSKFELWMESYLNRSKGFNGLVLYHDLTGKFVNGWRFDNGKPDKTVTFGMTRLYKNNLRYVQPAGENHR